MQVCLIALFAIFIRPVKSDRKLSFQEIANYEPLSQVTDQNALDLDQKIIEEQLDMETENSFRVAMDVYLYGGNSRSYALLTIINDEQPLEKSLSRGTKMVGLDAQGIQVEGQAFQPVNMGNTTISFQYPTTSIQSSHLTCKVGGLVGTGAENMKGCLAPNGTLRIEGFSRLFNYSYDPYTDNMNGRTIASMSIEADARMRTCRGAACPNEDFIKFYNYYGVSDYGHQWITAAFEKRSTVFKNGNADFSSYGYQGQREAIKKATVYMNVWMYAIYEFEDALNDCNSRCLQCNDNLAHAWDEGVAYYTGSLEGTTTTNNNYGGNGKMIHALADRMCGNFKTCGVSGDELATTTSKVNYDLLSQFVSGRQNLFVGNCVTARANRERIAQLMAIPLVQGTLRHAYIVEHLYANEKSKAEAATFAATVLPIVHALSPIDAQIIHDNTKVGSNTITNFQKVKEAFERNYKQMGITCKDVGGLWNVGTNDYYKGAAPCSDENSSPRELSKAVMVAIIVCVCGIALIAIGGAIFLYFRERAGTPVFTPAAVRAIS